MARMSFAVPILLLSYSLLLTNNNVYYSHSLSHSSSPLPLSELRHGIVSSSSSSDNNGNVDEAELSEKLNSVINYVKDMSNRNDSSSSSNSGNDSSSSSMDDMRTRLRRFIDNESSNNNNSSNNNSSNNNTKILKNINLFEDLPLGPFQIGLGDLKDAVENVNIKEAIRNRLPLSAPTNDMFRLSNVFGVPARRTTLAGMFGSNRKLTNSGSSSSNGLGTGHEPKLGSPSSEGAQNRETSHHTQTSSPSPSTSSWVLVKTIEAISVECPLSCEIVYSPICADNGVTYSNECEMKQNICMYHDNVNQYKEGRCEGVPEILSEQAVDTEPECSFECGDKVETVCGSNLKTYLNPCMVSKDSCEYNVDIGVLHPGACINESDLSHPLSIISGGIMCGIECPNTFNEVCGTDGVTYENTCELLVHSCKMDSDIKALHDGPCEDKAILLSDSNCDKPCPHAWDAVCGSDGNTYRNQCVLDRVTCVDDSIVKLFHGECTSLNTS